MNSAIERLLGLRVKDVMARKVVTVSPHQKMAEVACLLIHEHVSGVPVVDAERHCLGVLSATDFVRRQCQSGMSQAPDTLVGDHMSAAVQTISESDTLMTAARRLCHEHIHRLPVVDRQEKVIGWVSSLDIVAAMIHAIEE
jgi:CBS domain-containing protein